MLDDDGDGALTSEVVLVNFLVDEGLSNILNLIEVSQINLRQSVSLWESKLGLDFSWDKRKGFSSIVLDSAWGWNVHIWAKGVIAIRVHTIKDKNVIQLTSCLWIRIGHRHPLS